MRKIALLGLLVALTAGCGRSWMPSLRGAGCRGGGCLSAPALPPSNAPAGCNGCGNGTYGAGYSAYDSGEVITDSGYYGSGIVTDGYPQIINGGSFPAEGTLVQPNTAPAN